MAGKMVNLTRSPSTVENGAVRPQPFDLSRRETHIYIYVCVYDGRLPGLRFCKFVPAPPSPLSSPGLNSCAGAGIIEPRVQNVHPSGVRQNEAKQILQRAARVSLRARGIISGALTFLAFLCAALAGGKRTRGQLLRGGSMSGTVKTRTKTFT